MFVSCGAPDLIGCHSLTMLRPLNAATRAAHHAIGFTRAAPRRRRRAWGNSVGQQAQSPSRRTRLHLGRARPSEGWRRPAGRSCGSGCSRSAHLTYSATSDETAADLFVDAKLATDKTNASGRWNREDGYHLEPPPQKAPALVRRSPPPTRRRSDVQLHSASAENSHSESPRRLMIACNSATEPARTIPTATRRSRQCGPHGRWHSPKGAVSHRRADADPLPGIASRPLAGVRVVALDEHQQRRRRRRTAASAGRCRSRPGQDRHAVAEGRQRPALGRAKQ